MTIAQIKWTALFALMLFSCGSSGDTTKSLKQPAVRVALTEPYLESCNGDKSTLIVYLHTWSGDYTQVKERTELLSLRNTCVVSPNMNGENGSPGTCGSADAINRAAIVIQQAQREHNPKQTIILGASGGGYMALLLAGVHSELFQKALIWVPIYDLAAWYQETPMHRDSLLSCFGRAPLHANDPAYLSRSPKSVLSSASMKKVIITVGRDDTIAPPSHGRMAAEHLKKACPSCSVELVERDMGHDYQPRFGMRQLSKLMAM